MTLREKARQFAYDKHEDQLDDNGESYFYAHLEPVANIVQCITRDQRVHAAAYLHDILEDTDTSLEELRNAFGEEVADLVFELTQEGEKEHGYYFPRLESKEAVMIKFADRLSNISRMESWDQARQAQYLRKSKFWRDSKQVDAKNLDEVFKRTGFYGKLSNYMQTFYNRIMSGSIK